MFRFRPSFESLETRETPSDIGLVDPTGAPIDPQTGLPVQTAPTTPNTPVPTSPSDLIPH